MYCLKSGLDWKKSDTWVKWNARHHFWQRVCWSCWCLIYILYSMQLRCLTHCNFVLAFVLSVARVLCENLNLKTSSRNYDIAITFARWRFWIILKLFAITLQIMFKFFSIDDNDDLPRVYLCLTLLSCVCKSLLWTHTHTDKSSIIYKITGLFLC